MNMKTKKQKSTPSTFEFWKDNRVAGHFTLTLDEIKAKYFAYLHTKELSWVEYYGNATVAAFITDKEGLSSVADREAIWALEDALSDTRKAYYDEKDQMKN